MYKRTSFNSRHGKKIVVLYSEHIGVKSRGVAFIAHGLAGSKDQTLITTVSDVLVKAGYLTVRWDMRNTVGESEGSISRASAKSYFNDLEDVVKWASQQSWYQDPIILVGHSLGALVATIYAEQNPNAIKALIPISSVTSGKLVIFNALRPVSFYKWHRGYTDLKKAEPKAKIKFSFALKLLKYDTRTLSTNLTMPVLMIVGKNDKSTPVNHQKKLFKLVPSSDKSLEIIPGADHRFTAPNKTEELGRVIYEWVSELPTTNQ